MQVSQFARVVEFCRGVLAPPKAEESSDARLLEDFLQYKDEKAFAAIVRRHGPMVLGVCLRILKNYHDAEDAFQAVFLVLARKAASIRPKHMVGNWLYGVAYRTAQEARKIAGKRQSKERHYGALRQAQQGDAMDEEFLALLDAELNRLPDRYRAVLVLCDLEAKTRKEAAEQLGCKEGTVASRLDRARNLLAKRLTRRGLTLTGATLATNLAIQTATAAVPAALVADTVSTFTLAVHGGTTGILSAKVVALADRVLRAMLLSRLKIALGLALLAVVLIGVAIPLFGRQPAQKEQEASDSCLPYDAPLAQSNWGQAVDPGGDCTITPEGNMLAISVPPTPHDLSTEIGRVNAPRVLQELEGDFTIQVKVCGVLHPTAPATVPGRVPYQAGGLLLWIDDNNYVRLERAAFIRDGALQSGVAFESRENGRLRGTRWASIPDQDVYVRLERVGQQLLGSVSRDGQQWTRLAPLSLTQPPKVHVGVATVNAARQVLMVRFEELQIGR